MSDRSPVVTNLTVPRREAMATFAAAVLALTLLGAAPSHAQQGKVAMLLPGSINDQSWNAQGYGALARLKESGTEIAYSENVAPADHIETMKDYARRGFNPVIGHSGRFLSAAQRVGPEFEKTQFIVGSGASGSGKNITSIDYDNAHMGYLTGWLAAKMSKTGKIGSVNSLEGLPNVVAQVGGFRLGAKAANPKAEVRIVYISQMEDAAMAKEAALALIAGGADVIFGKLNAGQSGIIQAAAEKGVFATGRSFAHSEAAPKAVLTNIVEKWSDMYVAAVNDARAGRLKADYQVYGYNAPSGSGADFKYAKDRDYNPAVPAALAQEIDGLKKKLAAGEFKLSPTKEDARGGS